MRVSEVMVRDPVTFHPDTPVNELAKTMRERSIASVVLVNEGKPVGIVTERDLVHRVLADGRDPSKLRAGEICSKPMVPVSVNYSVDVDATLVKVNITIFGAILSDVLVVDQDGLPLDYTVSDSLMEVDSLGSVSVTMAYSTSDLTSKVGALWIFNTSTSATSSISLPAGSTITSLSSVPLEVGTLNGNPYVSMPVGRTEVYYVIGVVGTKEHALIALRDAEAAIIAAARAIVAGAAAIIAAVALVLRGRRREAESVAEPKTKLDIQAIFDENPSLRIDDGEVLRFIAESGGEAFANEIRERFDLPRTSAWRMFRRLISMGIVEERKIGGQSLIRISRRYRVSSA